MNRPFLPVANAARRTVDLLINRAEPAMPTMVLPSSVHQATYLGDAACGALRGATTIFADEVDCPDCLDCPY